MIIHGWIAQLGHMDVRFFPTPHLSSNFECIQFFGEGVQRQVVIASFAEVVPVLVSRIMVE